MLRPRDLDQPCLINIARFRRVAEQTDGLQNRRAAEDAPFCEQHASSMDLIDELELSDSYLLTYLGTYLLKNLFFGTAREELPN